MSPRLFFVVFMLLLAACNPPPNEVVRLYSGYENFHLYTGNLDVEFVKDSTEYFKLSFC